jgi:hypothetical protein
MALQVITGLNLHLHQEEITAMSANDLIVVKTNTIQAELQTYRSEGECSAMLTLHNPCGSPIKAKITVTSSLSDELAGKELMVTSSEGITEEVFRCECELVDLGFADDCNVALMAVAFEVEIPVGSEPSVFRLALAKWDGLPENIPIKPTDPEGVFEKLHRRINVMPTDGMDDPPPK